MRSAWCSRGRASTAPQPCGQRQRRRRLGQQGPGRAQGLGAGQGEEGHHGAGRREGDERVGCVQAARCVRCVVHRRIELDLACGQRGRWRRASLASGHEGKKPPPTTALAELPARCLLASPQARAARGAGRRADRSRRRSTQGPPTVSVVRVRCSHRGGTQLGPRPRDERDRGRGRARRRDGRPRRPGRRTLAAPVRVGRFLTELAVARLEPARGASRPTTAGRRRGHRAAAGGGRHRRTGRRPAARAGVRRRRGVRVVTVPAPADPDAGADPAGALVLSRSIPRRRGGWPERRYRRL